MTKLSDRSWVRLMLTISIAGYASLAIAAHASNPKSVQEFAEQYMAAFNKGDREALKRLRYPSTDKSDMQEIMDEIAEAEMAAGTKYNKFEVLPLDGKKSEPVVGPDGVVYEPNLPPTNVLKFIAKTETGSTSMTFPIGVKDGVYYQVAIVPSKGEQPAFKFGWQRFTPPKADWSVLLPNEPEPGIAALEMQVGRAGLDDPDLYGVVRNTASIKTTQHFFQCGAEGKRIHASDSKEKFRVARTTYAPETLKESFSDPKKTLDETVDLRTRSLPGKLVNVRDIELGGSPGREFEIRGEDGTYCLGRVYWIKDTLYELTFESKGEKPDMAAANKFLSSLEVN